MGLAVLVVTAVVFNGHLREQWYLWKLESGSAAERQEAAEKLAAMPRSLRVLIKSSQHEDPRVRKAAAHALGGFVFAGDPPPSVDLEALEEAVAIQGRSNPQAASWSANQLLGKPDATNTDDQNSWCTGPPDGGAAWIEVGYEQKIVPLGVLIRENYNPGAAVKVETADGNGHYSVVWRGEDPTRAAPGNFVVYFPDEGRLTAKIRVSLDTSKVNGWNQIDAVGLLSKTGISWATSAAASGSYADGGSSTTIACNLPPAPPPAGTFVVAGDPLPSEEVKALEATLTLTQRSNPAAKEWSVAQLLGEPDAGNQDDRNSWCTRPPDGGAEWIEVGFEQGILPWGVLIRENYNPGAVVKVEVTDSVGNASVAWAGQDPTSVAPGNFVIRFGEKEKSVSKVRVSLDTTKVHGWNQIDAVGLLSATGISWAIWAAASGSYAEGDPLKASAADGG